MSQGCNSLQWHLDKVNVNSGRFKQMQNILQFAMLNHRLDIRTDLCEHLKRANIFWVDLDSYFKRVNTHT